MEREKNFAVCGTPLGDFLIKDNGSAVTRIKKVNGNTKNRGKPSALSELAHRQLLEYFDGRRRTFDFPCEPQGTDFQKKVWQALCGIPYGETRSYKEIAAAAGNPKAARAVGMANNRNPIAIAIPCHRVIGADGKLAGYAGGLEMKEKLLKLEASNS